MTEPVSTIASAGFVKNTGGSDFGSPPISFTWSAKFLPIQKIRRTGNRPPPNTSTEEVGGGANTKLMPGSPFPSLCASPTAETSRGGPPGEPAARPALPRNSDKRRGATRPRKGRRTCTQSCKCAHHQRAQGPFRSIRNSAVFPAWRLSRPRRIPGPRARTAAARRQRFSLAEPPRAARRPPMTGCEHPAAETEFQSRSP